MSKTDMKTKLVNLLKVIFQFEDQDLDFGIYRIMNQKREDIKKFIDQELINKINEQLQLMGEEEKKKIFLLRNLSRKGIGFFQRAAGFYPDFILWIKDGNRQKMAFIDPKGLRNLGNFGDDKIQFCSSYIKVIEKKVKKEVREKKLKDQLDLYAFIVSVSGYDSIKDTFGEGDHTKEEFEEHNIVFQEGNYVSKIIDKIV